MEMTGIVFPDDLSGLIPILWFLVQVFSPLILRIYVCVCVCFNYKGNLFKKIWDFINVTLKKETSAPLSFPRTNHY